LLLHELNEANRFNICYFSSLQLWGPFILQSSNDGLSDEDDLFTGEHNNFAATDPRIWPTFAALPAFEQCAKLFTFAVKAVERLRTHFGVHRGDLKTGKELLHDWEGYDYELLDMRVYDLDPEENIISYYDRLDFLLTHGRRRLHLMWRLILLNVAAEDLSNKYGTYHFRKDKFNLRTGNYELVNTGSNVLSTGGSMSHLDREMDEYLFIADNGSRLPEDYMIMGSNKHLTKLANGMITKESSHYPGTKEPHWRIHDLCLLRNMCGNTLADKLDLLLPVRRVLTSVLDHLDRVEPDNDEMVVSDGSSDDNDEDGSSDDNDEDEIKNEINDDESDDDAEEKERKRALKLYHRL